jgi:hypothetical protein
MQIRTLFAGILAATLMGGLPTLQLVAQAADKPAKAQKAQKSKKTKKSKAAAAAPAAGAAAAAAGAAAVAGAGDDPKAALDKAIADAESARKKAASVDGEWRDTGKMIKEAEAAGAAGDFAKGIKLANEAQKQGELGYAQAMHEKGAGFPDYMSGK